MKFQCSVRWKHLVPIIVALTLYLLGCTPRDKVTEAPEPTGTSTIQPSSTSTSTQALSITSTSTVTPTATNTLTPHELDEWILNLLSTNGDCQFPCLFGLYPGQSMTNAYGTLIPAVSMVRIFEGSVKLRYSNSEGTLGGERVFLGFSAFPQEYSDEINTATELPNASIYTMQLSVDIRWLDGAPITSGDSLLEAMQPYALSNILSKYGMPSRALLQQQIGDRYATSSYLFGLALLYEDLGTAILYTGPFVFLDVGAAVPHCFQLERVSIVEVITHDPGDGLTLNEIFMRYFNEGDLEEYIEDNYIFDVEEATGVSIEEFYEIFKQPTTRCLFSPYDIWEY